MAVGGLPDKRGVVATCNYEARKFGIRSAMAAATARRKCPDLIIIRPDMDKYREASRIIHGIFRRYTDIIEPLSLDEAYLDVSNCKLHQGSATKIAQSIREAVRSEVGITISAGIAPNKFLAKVASDWNKPDGQFVVTPAQVDEFVAGLPVRKLHGVGKVTAQKMQRLGIETCKDLRTLSQEQLQTYFGSFGERLQELSMGIDNREVTVERVRKSVSIENTFVTDLPDLPSCLEQLPNLQLLLEKRLDRIGDDLQIRKQFVKIKFNDFVHTTAEMLSANTFPDNFMELCKQGFARGNRPVRLLGLGVRLAATDQEEKPEANDEEQIPLLLDVSSDESGI